jgi:hypothetical protein
VGGSGDPDGLGLDNGRPTDPCASGTGVVNRDVIEIRVAVWAEHHRPESMSGSEPPAPGSDPGPGPRQAFDLVPVTRVMESRAALLPPPPPAPPPPLARQTPPRRHPRNHQPPGPRPHHHPTRPQPRATPTATARGVKTRARTRGRLGSRRPRGARPGARLPLPRALCASESAVR